MSAHPFGGVGERLDPFAHLASGALLGRAARPTGPGWLSFAVFGTAAGIAPDVDAPLALLGPDAWARWHQIFTHSLVGLAWVPLALSVLPLRFAPWHTRFALALGGWGLHNVLDLCSRWPVPILWPLSEQRCAWELLERDFSWTIDMVLVVGLTLTLWDPVRHHARVLAAGTAVLVVIWLAAGLPT